MILHLFLLLNNYWRGILGGCVTFRKLFFKNKLFAYMKNQLKRQYQTACQLLRRWFAQ